MRVSASTNCLCEFRTSKHAISAASARVIIRAARCSRQRNRGGARNRPAPIVRPSWSRALAPAWQAPAATTLRIAALSTTPASLLRWSARINLHRRPIRSTCSIAEHFPDAFALARQARPAGTRHRRRQRRRPARHPAGAAPARALHRAVRTDRQEGGLPPDGDPRARLSTASVRATLARHRGRRSPQEAPARSTSRCRAQRWRPRSGWRSGRGWSVRAAGCSCSTAADVLPDLPERVRYLDGRRALEVTVRLPMRAALRSTWNIRAHRPEGAFHVKRPEMFTAELEA